MRCINSIILHCSATEEGRDYDRNDIDRWHKMEGWDGIGYHYVIRLDGTVEVGRSLPRQGAHCKGHNFDSIGICYIGGLDSNGNAKDTRTDAQRKSMHLLVKFLLQSFGLTENAVHVHSEYANKACPCFTRETFLKESPPKSPQGGVCYSDWFD